MDTSLSSVLELYCKMVSIAMQSLNQEKSGLDHKEYGLLKSLNTPTKIQDFLNSLPFNFEQDGQTHYSVRETLKNAKAHCFEGALVAAAALWLNGHKPLLLDLKTARPDFDHVVTLFSAKGGPASGGRKYWGALSKTNHAVLRYREPIYQSVRELAMSYFHEYFLPNGRKTLRSFSKPFDLSKTVFDNSTNWLTSEENLAELAHQLDRSVHTNILSLKQARSLRKTDKIEIIAGEIMEYNK